MMMSEGQFEPLDSYDVMQQRAEQVIAEANARESRLMRRIVLPLAAVTVGLGAVSWQVENNTPEPKEPSYSCTDFDDNVLKPPMEDRVGFAKTGIALDPDQIDMSGMATDPDFVNVDGTPIRTRSLGSIVEYKATLDGSLTMPSDYSRTVRSVLQTDAIRWGICNLEGGIILAASDADGLTNGEYQPDSDTVKLTFKAGGDDVLYDDARDVAYVASHEIGHSIRDEILQDDTDVQSIALIEQLNGLYKQQLSMALEDYRIQHGDQMAGNLSKLLSQFEALDSSIASKDTKMALKLAIGHIKDKLDTVGGLAELGVSEQDDSRYQGRKLISLSSLNAMIGQASEATTVNGHTIYGLTEFAQDYPDQFNLDLLERTDAEIEKFLERRFPSEHAMPGNTGGHPWDSSDELFASNWALVGQVSANRYDKITDRVPESYRSITNEQLKTMHELRSDLDPDSLAD